VSKKLKVSSIIEEREIEVFDISMPTNQNFILDNGVISHNCSHAVAYVVISYACAFLKHHYPLEWWASVLTNADDKEINEQFYKYVKDILLPPDINLSKEEIVIDYESGKLRQKLSTLAGLGVKLAQKIYENRPYTNIQDFVDKEVCGPAMARKMIYVGVLDSLFSDRNAPVLKKLQEYEDALEIKAYNEKLTKAKDPSKTKLKKGKIPDEFLAMSKLDAFLLKKQVYKGYQENYNEVIISYGKKITSIRGEKVTRFVGSDYREYALLEADMLKRLDEATLPEGEYVNFGVAGYVIDCKEFSYAGGEKKALKVIVDHSGYITEKVKWADYNTGKLEYDKNLKKGSFVVIQYKKSKDRPCSINDILIER
jgi:DNA polymerase III alpha subunit